MNSQEITAEIILRLRRGWVWILGTAILISAILIIFAMRTPKTFTSSATIFPLTATPDNSSSALNALMGGGDIGKNFTDENSVNIVDLAMSRSLREEVAAAKVPSLGNKTVAELMLNEYNQNRSAMEKPVSIASNDPSLITWASGVLKSNMTANITRTNSFVLTFTGRTRDLVRVISYIIIDKISGFYIDLKIEKAKRDFEFASKKVDSLRGVMNSKDQKLIAMDQHTLFTNTSQLQYRVPTENVIADKQMIRAQYANAVANQQNAAYKLQKATPVIKVLDKPDPPYSVKRRSKIVYGGIGFAGGLIVMSLIMLIPLLIKYLSIEFSKLIQNSPSKNVVVPKGNP